MDAVFAEMVGTHIGDDRGVGLRDRDSTAQDAAARGFENGRLARRSRITMRAPAGPE